jgi:methionyl-tRNA synthetase
MPAGFETTSADQALLDEIPTTFRLVGEFIEQTEFRHAIETIMSLVHNTNRYLSEQAPWVIWKMDPKRAQTILSNALQVLASLAILTEPFMPKQATRLRTMLNLPEEALCWQPASLGAGTKFGDILPLFHKLDENVIAQERERLNTQGATLTSS